MKKRHQRTMTALAVVTFLLGCSKSAEDCNYTASCDNSAERSDSGSGACSPSCSGQTPVCKESAAKCVECIKNLDCAGTGKPICDTTADECIQCLSNSDCTNAAASVCIAGTCTGSVGTCHACVADSECASGSRLTARCVSMNYKGSPHGSYCLQRADTVTCEPPYTVTFSSPSLSATTTAPNCGINQDATTCEAVLNLLTPTTCTRSNTCGAGLGDGQCQNLGGNPQTMRCTIPCTAATQCATGQTCTSAVNGYCR